MRQILRHSLLGSDFVVRPDGLGILFTGLQNDLLFLLG
jgi:hypothetical protein